MSWKSFACVAALSAMTAPAFAVPSISLSDDGSGTATLTVTATDTGSLAAEILLDATGGLTLTGASIVDAAWDTPNPGSNPLTGGTTVGLYLDELASGDIFVSYGSDVVTAGDYDLLDVTYTGGGNLAASGLVAALGVSTTGLMADVTIGSSLQADFNGDGTVDLLDLDILGADFGMTAPPATADANGDGNVDLLDLDILGAEFGMSSGSAVPSRPPPCFAWPPWARSLPVVAEH